jgi:hypothetical protein
MFPFRVATRWAVRCRRNRVQSSTLAGNLRVLGKTYAWAKKIAKIDLDDFLCSGRILNARQIESLASYLREPSSDPISLARADDIVEDISAHSGIDISWHRLRHTWAEKMADLLCNVPTGADQLQWLGGWTSDESPKLYIQNAIARGAQKTLQDYHDKIETQLKARQASGY